MKVRAVILTKSYMHGGFCVAGIDIDKRKWVRFVLDKSGASLMSRNMCFQNGEECEVLDVVTVDVSEYAPVRNHTENRIINPETWQKLGHVDIDLVVKKFYPAENYNYIFGDTRHCINDEKMRNFNFSYSLMLVNVKNFNIIYEPSRRGKIKAKASFTYAGKNYNYMRVTDPDYTHDNNKPVNFANAYIVVSMPDTPFEVDGNYYKFVAKIFPA